MTDIPELIEAYERARQRAWEVSFLNWKPGEPMPEMTEDGLRELATRREAEHEAWQALREAQNEQRFRER